MRDKRQDFKIQRMSPRNSIVDKNKLQEKKKNEVIYKGRRIRLMAVFQLATQKTKTQRNKNCQKHLLG